MVADDMPKSELGSYGAAGDLTPRLDALARDAVRFDAAHSPSPLCTPARYSLLTGRHAGCAFAPSTRRVRQLSLNGTMRELPELANIEFNVNLPALAAKPAHATVAQLLAQHGVPSGLVGKWHLGYPPSTVNSSERTFVQSARMPRQWNAVKPLVLREYKSLQAHVRAAGFAFVERLYVNNLYPEQHVLPAEMLRHNVEWIAEGAAKFVESHRGAPYFLYVGWTLPHNPDVGESIDADVRYTPGGIWAVNRSLVRAQRDAVKRRTAGLPDQPRMGHAHYPLALAWLDAGVGLVLDALERNALVAFTADHHSYDKRHCYTYGSQVPLIVRWPEHVPPRTAAVAALASHLDLLPTILDAANVPPSLRALAGGAAVPPLPGASLAPLLLGGQDSLHAHLFCEIGQSRAVFTERARLLYAPQIKPLAKGGSTDTRNNYQAHRHHPAYWRPLQLYDLGADADEQVNLANDTARAPLLAEMRALLRGRMEGDACA